MPAFFSNAELPRTHAVSPPPASPRSHSAANAKPNELRPFHSDCTLDSDLTEFLNKVTQTTYRRFQDTFRQMAWEIENAHCHNLLEPSFHQLVTANDTPDHLAQRERIVETFAANALRQGRPWAPIDKQLLAGDLKQMLIEMRQWHRSLKQQEAPKPSFA